MLGKLFLGLLSLSLLGCRQPRVVDTPQPRTTFQPSNVTEELPPVIQERIYEARRRAQERREGR